MKNFYLLFFICLINSWSWGQCPSGTAATGVELVVNGDFESGNTGFASAYTFTTCATIGLYGDGSASTSEKYSVSPAGCYGITDRLGGNSNVLHFTDLNNVSPGKVMWSETVSVTTNKNYSFSFWSMEPGPDCNYQVLGSYFDVYINNQLIEKDSVGGCDTWFLHTYSWFAATGTAGIEVRLGAGNFNLGLAGMDPFFDDFSFKSCSCSAPVTGAITAVRDTICNGTPAILTLTNNTGDIQWQDSTWGGNFTDISGETNTGYNSIPSQTTYYRVRVGTGGCTSNSEIKEIIVKPSPVASFYISSVGSNGRKISFNSDSSQGATFFDWDFGDAGTSTEKNPDHTFSKDTLHHVCLTVTNGSNCSFTICKDILSGPTGVSNIVTENDFIIYPNPFSNEIFISNENENKIDVIEVTDVLGRIIYTEQFKTQNLKSETVINLSPLSDGMYFLIIKTRKSDYIQKVIKQ